MTHLIYLFRLGVLSLLLVSASALAERDFGLYFGGGAGFMKASTEDVFGGDVQFRTAEIVAGMYWRWLGLETRNGASIEDETLYVGETGGRTVIANSSIESYRSLYLRAQWDHEVGHLYGLLGRSEISVENLFPQTGLVSDAADTDNSWGLGAGLKISKRLQANLEYKSVLSSDDHSFSQTGFSIIYRL